MIVAKMHYLGGGDNPTNAEHLTVGQTYEVLAWFGQDRVLTGLVLDDNNALFVAFSFEDMAEWSIVKV